MFQKPRIKFLGVFNLVWHPELDSRAGRNVTCGNNLSDNILLPCLALNCFLV